MNLNKSAGGGIKETTRARRGTAQAKRGGGEAGTGRSSAPVRGKAEGRGGEKEAWRVPPQTSKPNDICILSLVHLLFLSFLIAVATSIGGGAQKAGRTWSIKETGGGEAGWGRGCCCCSSSTAAGGAETTRARGTETTRAAATTTATTRGAQATSATAAAAAATGTNEGRALNKMFTWKWREFHS